MLILAVYYTFADVVLLGQCFYYRGFTLSDSPVKTIKSLPENDDGRITMIDEEAVEGEEEVTEQTYLLSPNQSKNNHQDPTLRQSSVSALLRLNSPDSQRDRRHSTISVVNLSPAVPFAPTPTPKQRNRRATLYQALFNFTALLLVCATGASGWWISNHYSHSSSSSTSPTRGHHGNGRRKEIEAHDILHFDISGQIFGYLCALLYLGSRIPQILLNFRRKSTEGVSMLFFLFACVGNLTYVFSVMVYEPTCALTRRRSGCGDGEWQEQYTQYILVNLSWLIGSAGTLALDLGIFVQFWMYRGRVAGIS
ncbi:MAG: hypothetical protein MMC33_008079 [Icmadophila ericetorum]|nr:hypothetical protein [Icmadophila ericetorum]